MKTLLLSILLATFAQDCAHGLDLSARVVETVMEEGGASRELEFADGKKRVLYTFPRNWRTVLGEGGLLVIPPDVSQSDLTIQKQELTNRIEVGKEEAKVCAKWVASALPADSTEVVWEPEAKIDPLRMEGHHVIEINVSYRFADRTWNRCVWFLYADKTLIRFIVTSPADKFKDLKEMVRVSLYSWRWEEYSQAKPPQEADPVAVPGEE